MDDRFISEKNAEEVRKKRQEEWEKVRKANDPVVKSFLLSEVPEEDHRSLYERLKEVRDKKQAEYDEEHKFKNMIRGLDSEECEFLSSFENMKEKEDKKKKQEEAAVLSEFERARCRTIPDDKVPSVSRLRFKAVRDGPPRPNRQAELLKGAIKRKSITEDYENGSKKTLMSIRSQIIATRPTAMKVVGMLPGIANYASSSSNSDSDNDSDYSGDLPVLPALIPTTPDKNEKQKSATVEVETD
ncbi:unnamed protein product [Dracunculus medinensis]|uniref:Nefa_Nip30_N domain-containing protein n=1 Tax=Dracunculus medinensis TaxID=318479 RepID=A0A0N4UB44_DRAME|nr:unnamed protein product [Dracunculus medinensis]